MRLVVPFPPSSPQIKTLAGVEVRIADRVLLVIGHVEPLPPIAQHWADRQIAGSTPPDRISVKRGLDRELAGGWPVSLVESDLVDAAGNPVERRLHALYRFVGHGCAVVARARPAVLDAHRAELEQMMLGATIDFADGSVVALSQIWAGLDVQESNAPDISVHKVDEIK